MFAIGMEVEYHQNVGVIDFMCSRYIRIKLPSVEGRSNPLLVVYSEFQKEVIVLKDSTK